jgi:hypothetical protein
LEENDTSGWQVQLNSGEMVFEDDDRPGHVPSSWERLCLHCAETGEYPVNMWIRFRDHVEPVGSDKDGYYLFKSLLHSPGWAKPNYYYIAGFLEDGVIKCTKWKLPEIIADETFDRAVESGGVTNVFGLPALIRRRDEPATIST